MKEPRPQPKRRDAALILALLLVAGSLWLTVLGPLAGRSGWLTLAAIAILLFLFRVAEPWVRRGSRWVSGRARRGGRRDRSPG